jgi:hypothetical protein
VRPGAGDRGSVRAVDDVDGEADGHQTTPGSIIAATITTQVLVKKPSEPSSVHTPTPMPSIRPTAMTQASALAAKSPPAVARIGIRGALPRRPS